MLSDTIHEIGYALNYISFLLEYLRYSKQRDCEVAQAHLRLGTGVRYDINMIVLKGQPSNFGSRGCFE